MGSFFGFFFFSAFPKETIPPCAAPTRFFFFSRCSNIAKFSYEIPKGRPIIGGIPIGPIADIGPIIGPIIIGGGIPIGPIAFIYPSILLFPYKLISENYC